jgi:hypothetical protein
MKNIYDLFSEIETIWKEKKKTLYAEELEKRIGRGSTGGEIFSYVVRFFRELKSNEDEAYFEAKTLIDEALVRYENFIKQH